MEHCTQAGAEYSLPIPYIYKSATVQRNPCCHLSSEEGVHDVILCYVLVGPQSCGGIVPNEHPTHFLLPWFHSQVSLHLGTFVEGWDNVIPCWSWFSWYLGRWCTKAGSVFLALWQLEGWEPFPQSQVWFHMPTSVFWVPAWRWPVAYRTSHLLQKFLN